MKPLPLFLSLLLLGCGKPAPDPVQVAFEKNQVMWRSFVLEGARNGYWSARNGMSWSECSNNIVKFLP